MKKIIITILFVFTIASLALLSSCVSIPKDTFHTRSSAVDYTKYSENGFFMTEANSVSFRYEPLGSITAIARGGYEVIGSDDSSNFQDDTYGKPAKKVKYDEYRSAYPEDALEELYNKALEMGANGVINLKFTYLSQTNSLIPEGWMVTGMAIKK